MAAKLLRPFAFHLRGRLLLAFVRRRLGQALGLDRLRRDDGPARARPRRPGWASAPGLALRTGYAKTWWQR